MKQNQQLNNRLLLQKAINITNEMNNASNNNENNDENSIKPNAATHNVLLNAIVISNVGGEIAE